MAENTEPAFADDPRRRDLLSKKLGSLLTWKRPGLMQTIGPFDPTVFDAFEVSSTNLIGSCVAKLRSFSEDAISEILKAVETHSSDAQGWTKYLVDEISALRRSMPPWFAGGWGHPDHQADFDYWAKMPRFELGELTCLSVGIDANEYTWKKLYDLSCSEDRPKFWPALEFLVKRYELLHRTFGFHGRSDNVRPREFIDWANKVEFEVHPVFWKELTRFNKTNTSPSGVPTTKKPDRREIDSIAMLFTAMAIDQLGYEPKQPRSPIPKEIAELAAGLGMSISEDTILKYLRIGASFIPDDWKRD